MSNADQSAPSPVGLLEYCPRSLAPTLAGAFTMFALFTAQAWGYKMSEIFSLDEEEVEGGGWITALIFSLCQPLLFLQGNLITVLEAWEMERRLKQVEGITWDPRSLRCLLAARAWIKAAAPPEESLVVANSPEVESSNPFQIFEQMMLNPLPPEAEGADQTVGNSLSAVNSLPVDQYFLRLSDDGKQALLELGFVPSYEQLRYVKSKRGVEITIVALQAAGYLLGIVERMAADQRISPIEALATFLGILMILHAFFQWFASSAYERTLLFHLNPLQFFSLRTRLQVIEARSSSDEGNSSDLAAERLFVLLFFLVMLLPLGPAICFAIEFMEPRHGCLICFLPALFFSLSVILLIALYITLAVFKENPKIQDGFAISFFFVLLLLYVSSIVIAVIATILEWDHKFNEPTKSWYRWIIPHIGS